MLRDMTVAKARTPVNSRLGILAGIGALAIPGVGPLIAAGPIMATLAGGAVGGFAGALVGAGIPEFEAKRYAGIVEKGSGILLSVHCATSDEIDRAKHALKATGGEDISSTGESSVSWEGPDKGSRPELSELGGRERQGAPGEMARLFYFQGLLAAVGRAARSISRHSLQATGANPHCGVSEVARPP
jgi:hypothetical protein